MKARTEYEQAIKTLEEMGLYSQKIKLGIRLLVGWL